MVIAISPSLVQVTALPETPRIQPVAPIVPVIQGDNDVGLGQHSADDGAAEHQPQPSPPPAAVDEETDDATPRCGGWIDVRV